MGRSSEKKQSVERVNVVEDIQQKCMNKKPKREKCVAHGERAHEKLNPAIGGGGN